MLSVNNWPVCDQFKIDGSAFVFVPSFYPKARKISKLDEPDMQNTAREVGTSS